MQRQVTWVCGLAAVLLVGCSTPIGPLAPPPLPDNPATAANVVVYRDAAPVDDALLMLFTINGAGTYQLRPKERYNFVLGAGTYEFGYQMGMSKCSDAVQIDARGNYVFKLGSGCAIILESQ
jgi:hypothetical protein